MGFGVRMEHIPPVTQHVIEFSDRVRLPLARLFVIVAAVVSADGAVDIPEENTLWLGIAGRCPGPRGRCALQGISIKQTARIAMFIGAGLAGIAGALTAHLWCLSIRIWDIR